MARPLRITYEGAWYHVMNRGLAKSPIFLNDRHRKIFIDLLSEVHQRYQAEIHAYCLMGNHYHLLIRTPLGNISRIMRYIDGVYTQRFNQLVGRDGPLLRGRYKAVLVEADRYFLRLTRYIHLNPVESKITKNPESYEWSSCKYFFNEKPPAWLNTEFTLGYFSVKNHRKNYQEYLSLGNDEEIINFYLNEKILPILGSGAFSEKICDEHLKGEHKINEIPDHKIYLASVKNKQYLNMVCAAVVKYFNIGMDEVLRVKKGAINMPRLIAIYLACHEGGSSLLLSDTGKFFGGVSASAVSKACARVAGYMIRYPAIVGDISEIKKQIQDMSNVRT
jgi:putative transposase